MIPWFFKSENRNFQRLWWGQLISQFGDRIHQLALVGLIAERAPGSVMGLTKLLAFTIIPVFLIQPFAGVFVDRWDRRTTLLVCDILRGLLVLAIPFIFFYWESMVPIYIIVFLVFCFSRFYSPAKMSIIPDLVKEESLLVANSLVSTTGMIAFVLGCALGGVLVDKFGSRAGFFVDSATFFFSGALVFSIDLSRRLRVSRTALLKAGREWAGPIRRSVWVELKEGLRYPIHQPELRFVLNMLFMILFAAGAIYVVIVVFIQKAFQSVTRDLGILAVFLGIGLFLGALSYGRWGRKFAWHKTIFFCLITGGVMLASFALLIHAYPNIFVAMGLAFLLGLMVGPIFIAANTIVHVVSDEKMRGKVFSAVEIVIHFAFLTAMLLSSWLSQFISEVWILTGVGVIFTCVGLGGFVMKPKFVDLTNVK